MQAEECHRIAAHARRSERALTNRGAPRYHEQMRPRNTFAENRTASTTFNFDDVGFEAERPADG